MVTTRSASRAASEVPSLPPTPVKASNGTTPRGTPRAGTSHSPATPTIPESTGDSSRRKRVRSKSKKSTTLPPPPPSTSTRRKNQKDRIRALRASALMIPDESSEPTLRAALLDLLGNVEEHETICISRIPRAVSPDWVPLLPATRALVWDAATKGTVEVLVDGAVVAQPVDGPLRIRRGKAFW